MVMPGWQEMLVIMLVIGLIFGPKQLPKLAESMGKTIKILKRDAREIQGDLDEIKKEVSNDSTTSDGT